MAESDNFIEKADRLAGITTITLVILGIIQIILGETISKSIALTANGIDCIGDGFVSGVVWIGLLFFRRPADHKFNYGYYKMENLASIAAAIVMLILAAYIGFRSYNQFIHPHEVKLPIIGAVVASIAAIIALSLGFYKYSKGKKSKMGSVRLEAFNTIKDGVASGLTVIALLLASAGFEIADAIVGFIIAGIIVTIGFASIKESSLILVDACDEECVDRSSIIKEIAEEFENVESAHVVRLRRSGPIYFGELEIKVPCELKIKDFNKVKNEIVKKVKSTFPEIKKLTITAIEEDLE